MKLEHFQQVLEISRTRSFSQAARNLYISQPSLSYSIKQLEEEIGHEIFKRSPEGVAITEFGQDYIHHASIILKELDILEDYCRFSQKKHRLTLKVVTLNINSASLAFSKMIERYANAPIDFSLLHYLSIDKVIDQLLYKQADLGLIGIISTYRKSTLAKLQANQISYHKLTSSPVYAVVGSANPLFFREGPITLNELLPYPIILYGDEGETPDYSIPYALGVTEQMTSIARVNSSHMLYSSVENTTAFTLATYGPKIFHALYGTRNLRMLEISDSTIFVDYGWIKPRKLPSTDLASEFLTFVTELY